MIEINGRKIKVKSGTRSQTVNICTADNVHGIYEYIVRLHPPFIAEDTLLRANFASADEIVPYLQLHHSGEVERPRNSQSEIIAPIKLLDISQTISLTEMMMAWDVRDLLVEMGLKKNFRVDICSGIAGQFPPNTYDHNLPVYSRQSDECFTDKARQIARLDLIVVDTDEKIVELTLEFEIDTNPKNLIGNYISVFIADEYKSKTHSTVYKFDVTRTAHFLLACLDPRKECPNQQAAVQKGRMVAAWLNSASVILSGNVNFGKIRTAHAIAGDNWQNMKETFARHLKSTCPHLFETRCLI